MAKILMIETSTDLCSVALEKDGAVIASRRSDIPRLHASMTAVYCDEVLREAGLAAADLDAVCVSAGPGSYTGLRVGLSTAKGLCFGTGAKLLCVCSLDVLAQMALQKGLVQEDTMAIVPMIDARRMEVYTALYSPQGERRSEVEAKIVDENSFKDIARSAVFIGDGALKCRDTIGAGIYEGCCPEAAAMAPLAEREYAALNWKDVAYEEPFYLKDFTVTQSKKKLF